VIVDLEGAMDLSGGGSDITHMKAGEAHFLLQGSFVQLINRDSSAARYLSFFLLPNGMPLTVKAA
jgi:hypothetical protein